MELLPIAMKALLPLSGRLDNESSKPVIDGKGKGFAEILGDSLKEVQKLEGESDRQTAALVSGQTTDIHQVMIAAEKASTAVQLTVQVRNKVIDAYNEIMRLQV